MKYLLLAALAATALAGCSSSANSKEMEDKYLAKLDSVGIYTPHSKSVEIGHQVCDRIDQGMSPDQVSAALVNAPSARLTPFQAGTIVGAAVGAFCPKYADLIR